VAGRATHRSWILSYKYAAAAAVVGLVIGGAALFTFLKKKNDLSTKPIAERFRNDVAPGSEKAILELADGRRIALDSMANGGQLQQGTTRIMKQNNGQVQYHPEEMPPGVVDVAVAYNTVSTPRGGQYRVVLPDGSRVWLNAASSLRFPTGFAGNERKVELVGEAYFEVAKNPAMPFKVTVKPLPGNTASAPMEVEVLGTEFNINAYGDETDRRTTLIQGSVKIMAGSGQSLLKPGQQARVNAGGLQIMPEVDTDEAIAWKNGLFQFKEANIQSIMRQVSRWYDVEVEYKGNINQQFFGKIPRRVQVSTLLKILESTGWVHFAIEGKKITVAP
jgi:ferric-dicitrate binding protein FerR (iron transport regulator)